MSQYLKVESVFSLIQVCDIRLFLSLGQNNVLHSLAFVFIETTCWPSLHLLSSPTAALTGPVKRGGRVFAVGASSNRGSSRSWQRFRLQPPVPRHAVASLPARLAAALKLRHEPRLCGITSAVCEWCRGSCRMFFIICQHVTIHHAP